MAAKQLILDNFIKGDHLAWYVTTQADNTITVELADSNKRYFRKSKTGRNIFPSLSQGEDTQTGDRLTLTIEIPQSTEIKTWINNTAILSPEGRTVGECFTLCAEDAYDEDYDDVQVSIIGWKKKG